MWNGASCLHEPSPFRRSNRGDLAPTFDSTLIMAVLRRHLSRGWTQSTDAQQVVGGAREIQQLGVASYAAQPRLAQHADGLTPAEELLDTLAHGRRAIRAHRVPSRPGDWHCRPRERRYASRSAP